MGGGRLLTRVAEKICFIFMLAPYAARPSARLAVRLDHGPLLWLSGVRKSPDYDKDMPEYRGFA